MSREHIIIIATVFIYQPLDFVNFNHLILLFLFQLFVLPKRTFLFLNNCTNIGTLFVLVMFLLTFY